METVACSTKVSRPADAPCREPGHLGRLLDLLGEVDRDLSQAESLLADVQGWPAELDGGNPPSGASASSAPVVHDLQALSASLGRRAGRLVRQLEALGR